MSVTTGRKMVRRVTGLLPLFLVAMLFAAPLIIWLVKNDQPAIVTERLKARIVSVGPATASERRVVVTLDEGLTVIIRTKTVPPEAKPGDDIDVIRSTSPTGEVDYELEE